MQKRMRMTVGDSQMSTDEESEVKEKKSFCGFVGLTPNEGHTNGLITR